jgi:fatty acid desaturase
MEKFRATNGISFCGALTILFIALKLLGEIDWNWFWVLSPLWIPYGIWLILCIILLFFFKSEKSKWLWF